jgi:uncharacterized membrane protein YkvA (DUF1232 family)
MLESLKLWARRLKSDVLTVYFAARDPATPWWLRAFAMAVAGYALSPIDLIPDFVPVLGYLDDLLIVPLGLYLVLRWLPPSVLTASRARAAEALAKPRSVAGAAVIVAIWVAAGLAALAWWLRR